MKFLSQNTGISYPVFIRLIWIRACAGLILYILISQISYAEDSLSKVMQSMQADNTVKIAYQEIRHLELMDQPWYGSGYLYALPPDLMIKEQIEPRRLLMGVQADTLYYFDPENNVRHQAEMDMDNPLSLNISIFKALIHADADLLKRLYRLEFSHYPERWLMNLQPKQKTQSDFTVAVSGRLEQGVDMIKIQQADGDITEFLLQKQTTDSDIEKKLNQLYLELQGE